MQYRIGDFAAHMGVTPDLLKHYEDQGLLWAEHRENGYRYYPFQTSPKFLAAMQLKSYGIPIRSMQALINDASPEELMAELQSRTAHMEKEAERLRMLIEEERSLEAWMARRQPQEDDWEVTDFESFYFLPHSLGLVFIENDDIYKILPDWLGRMPLVKSTLAVSPTPAEDGTLPSSWGLSVRESTAKAAGIPVNESVEFIPSGKAFILHYAGPARMKSESLREDPDHPVLAKMRAIGVKPGGRIFKIIRLSARMDQPNRLEFADYIAPIA